MSHDCPQCPSVSRRHFLNDCGYGLGKIALAGLLTGALDRPASASSVLANPLAPKKPHFPAKAKAVIHLFMAGAPSQLDLFDYKPELAKLEGKPLPPSVIGGQRYAFIRPDAAVLGPRFKFARHGQCGAELSEMLPHLAKVVDDICLVKIGPHRSVQPRSGADLLQHRLLAARPAEPGLVGALRPGRGSQGPAGLRRDVHRQPASAAARPTGRAASCPRSTPACASAQPGRPDPQRLESRRACDAEAPARLARPGGRSQPPAAGGGRRSGDRHADRLLRDGLPAANVGARADGPPQREQGDARSVRLPIPTSRRSRGRACWRGGWSSAACGS